MPRKYENSFKLKIVNLIVNEGKSTKRTAEGFNIPLKTVEKWITKYNKDPNVYNVEDKVKNLEDDYEY